MELHVEPREQRTLTKRKSSRKTLHLLLVYCGVITTNEGFATDLGINFADRYLRPQDVSDTGAAG